MSLILKSDAAYTGSLGALPDAAVFSVFPAQFGASTTRRLDPNYTGAAVRVRRASDNAESDIGFTLSGDFDEAGLLAFVGANDGFVTTLYGQAGGYNAVQASTTRQPKIVTAGVAEKLNGFVMPLFDGVDDALVITAAGALNLFRNVSYGTLFAVGNSTLTTSVAGSMLHVANNASGARLTIGANASGQPDKINSATRRLDADALNQLNSTSVLMGGGLHVWSAMADWSANTKMVYQDNVTVATGTAAPTAGATSDTASGAIGIGAAGPALTAYWKGHIGEVFGYNTNQAANIAKLNKRMKAFYGL